MGSGIGTVKAGPTKEFFVSMITRDIQLPDAIVELIDNSIDGIKRKRVENYAGYFIRVNFNRDSFVIEDNCGGIDLSIAMEYAFVFGKPQSARDREEKVETTGTFGIGMKRALFKMGSEFEVSSKASCSDFVLRVDVNNWISEEVWDFPLAIANDDVPHDEMECGTKITVSKLFSGISRSFMYTPFINEVISIVQRRANAEISRGLTIEINGTRIEGAFLSVINGGRVLPYKHTFTSSDITVMVIAGIAPETDPDKAGWYVYCNNREVLSADKSSLTTWKDENDLEGIKYHNDYAAFRGFVFFTSIYPEYLPWNTSKTGVDGSSAIYSEARSHMINAFKVITSELKKLAKLEEEIRTTTANSLKRQTAMSIHFYAAHSLPEKTDVSFVDFYKEQTISRIAQSTTTRITYDADKDMVNKVKQILSVSKNRDVGIKTFDYFVEMEGLEDA